MRTSKAGIDLIKSFETLELEAYPDPGSRDGEPWTLGWGTTWHGPKVSRVKVREGDTCTEDEADAWLVADVAYLEVSVARLVKVSLTQHQFDALVSFIYNVGVAAFADSTMLRLLNNRDYLGAAAQFKRWNRNDGKVMRGLTRRRAAEERMFLRTAVGVTNHFPVAIATG